MKRIASAIITATVFAFLQSSNAKDAPQAANAEDEVYEIIMRSRNLTDAQAAELEAKLAQSPVDVNAATGLLVFYNRKRFTDAGIKSRRTRLILRLIKERPDAGVLSMPESQLLPRMDDTAEVKRLWTEQLAKRPDDLKILANAAANLQHIDDAMSAQCLEKGKSLDPKNPKWSESLGRLYLNLNIRNANAADFPVKALAELENAYTLHGAGSKAAEALLDNMARAAFSAGDMEKAEKYASEMLKLTAGGNKSGNDWNYGNLIYNGNFILGRIAMKKGDIDEAEKRLSAAGETPGSPQLNSFGPDCTLAAELFKAGRKDAVIRFLMEISKFVGKKDVCDYAIERIKRGESPFVEPVENNRFIILQTQKTMGKRN